MNNEEQDRFGELLDAYLEAVRSGKASSPEAFAAANPDLEDELRAVLPLLVDMEHVAQAGGDQPLAVPPPDFSGTDFQLLRRIGGGGMGVVYEALQTSLNRKVAVKILSPARPVEDEALNRLQNEARVIAQLYHPNIVKVYTAGHLGGSFFYAMELLDGTDLARMPPTAPREIAKVGLDAARALAYAHGCGVLHCDVKPSNIFRGADGVLKIGDFGLALSTNECGGHTSSRDGTLRYMAPERLAQREIDFSSDQYSLGATLYEFLTKRPLRRDTNPAHIIQEIRHQHFRFPPGCDPDLSAIIAKSLSDSPADRYPSMTDMAEDLQRYLDHRPVMAARPSAARRLLLYARRDPIRAAACAFAIVCATCFIAALAIGLVNTRRAMELSRANAATANGALKAVFRHVAQQPPSPSDIQLLNDVLPYYDNLSDDAQLTDSDRATVYDTLVKCALRIGKYDLAEKLLRKRIALQGYDANDQSRLAFAIQRQGRKDEADSIWNEIATRFSANGSPDDQAIAARALVNVTDDVSSPNYKLAFDILQRILARDPTNQKARFEYARMLIEECPFVKGVTIPGVPNDPVALLDELVARNPQRLQFAIARMHAIYLRFKKKLDADEAISDEEVQQTLARAEELFMRSANHPGVALLVFRTRIAYLEYVKWDNPPPRFSRESGRLDEFCLSIFNSPDVPEKDKADILEIQLDKLADMTDSPRRFKRRARIVREELDKYTGQGADEFEERLRTLQSKVPDMEPPPPHRRPYHMFWQMDDRPENNP